MTAPESVLDEDRVATDAATTRSALGKASLRLIPLIALGYGAAYIDRVNISFAALQMNRDLHFSATTYGLGAGLFFLSYAACEVPSNLLLYRFGARRWLARIMFTWGLLAMAMIFVRTPWQFYTARFLLGMAEAGFFPGVIFYLMQWFPPGMRARSVSRFYISFPLSSVVMGLVAGPLLHLQGRAGLAGWQWLFFVEALPAIILSIVFLLYLPDTPNDAPWLTPAERDAILVAVPPAPPHSHSILPALRDRRVWLLSIFMFCTLASNYAYSFSAPPIVQKLTGLSVTHVGFVIAAMNVLGALSMLLNGTLSDRAAKRSLHPNLTPFRYMLPGCVLAAFGFLAFGLSRQTPIALAGLTCIVVGYFSVHGPLWSVSTAFLCGRSAAACIAAMNTIGILGGFLGPYWIGIARDLTGDYQRGLLFMSIPMLLAAAITLYLHSFARRQSA